MSHGKSVATLELSESNGAKLSATPLTRTSKVTKKRAAATLVGDEGDDALLDMDLSGASREKSVSPMRQFDLESPSPTGLNANATFAPAPRVSRPTPPIPPAHVAPASAVRARAPEPGFHSAFNNLPTCMRLTPAVPPGRMELVQTGIKLELAISNFSRSAARGLEDFVNERAAGFKERAGFTVERIKLYSQAGEVVLFGKIGTAYDVRALHYLFRDIAAGSNLRYCQNTFPDLDTALEKARPWFNQGKLDSAPCSMAAMHTDALFCAL